MSLADIGQRFHLTESDNQYRINNLISLTQSENKSGIRDHLSLRDKLRILHLSDIVASVSRVCSEFSIGKIFVSIPE